MFVPQRQTNTPTLGSCPVTSISGGYSFSVTIVPLASVLVEAMGPSDTMSTMTNATGYYSLKLSGEPTWTADVTFHKPGFGDTTVSGYQFAAGDSTQLDVPMCSGECSYIVGNVNGDTLYNGLDIIYGVAYFKGGSVPKDSCDCPPHGTWWYASGTVNGDCLYNGVDIGYGVSYLSGNQDSLVACPSCPPANGGGLYSIKSADIARLGRR